MLSIERLKQLVSYDPETGLWTRLIGRPGRNAGVGDIARHVDGCGYVQVHLDKKYYRSCRLAFFYMTGEWPADQVDHIDRVRTNDRWSNLRLATRSQNKANCGIYANNSIGAKGVSSVVNLKSRPYRARIQINGKPKHLGYFDTPEAANAAYALAAQELFGEFAQA